MNPILYKRVVDFVQMNKYNLPHLWKNRLSEDDNVSNMISYFLKYPEEMNCDLNMIANPDVYNSLDYAPILRENSYYLRYIHRTCERFGIKNYTINDDGTIDVRGGVCLQNLIISKLPLSFNIVDGDFLCYNNCITDLIGSPYIVGCEFNFSHNNVRNFNNSPKKIGGDLTCGWNNIRDIYNIPKVGGLISISYNPVAILVDRFINNVDRDSWIEFFNDCDIIRDDHIIWDRLVFFYDYLDITINDGWREKIESYYNIQY